MTLDELLNSEMDFASLLALARQGLAWWGDELVGLLPSGLRDRLSARPRLWLEPEGEAGWRTWSDGRPLAPGTSPPAGAKLGLLLPADAVLVREIPAPRMATADLKRMLSLDIDRLSPLAPDLIHFDLEIADRDGEDGARTARLAIVERDRAAELLARARATGLEPAAMGARFGEGSGNIRFDFLPSVVALADDGPPNRTRLYGWIAAAGLILVNLAILVGRDMIDVARLTQAVDGQRPVVEAVQRLRRRVQNEDAARRTLLARGQRGDPLRMLNVVTQALPAGAWVQRLEWNGQTLRLVGFKAPEIDIAAAIRGSGAFTNPRVISPEPAPGSASSSPGVARPFDVTADARTSGRP